MELLAFVIGSGGKGVARFDSMNPGRFVAFAALLHHDVDTELVDEALNRINASQWLHEELGAGKKAIDVARGHIERVIRHVRGKR